MWNQHIPRFGRTVSTEFIPFSAAAVVACLMLSLPAGCAPRGGEEPREKIVRSRVERGPVRLTVEVEPAPARLSDQPIMTVTIDYEQGVQLAKPLFGEALGDFRIVELREPLPQIKQGREIVRQILTLQPARTGRLEIFPIGVEFSDARRGGDGRTQTIETDRIALDVTSIVETKQPSLDELRDAASPIAMRRSMTALVLWLAVAVALVGGAVGVWLWRRRKRAADAVVPSPQQLAFGELQELIESGLARRDVKLFYVELTGIVRRYIERTTAIRAPEQTTEEFLHAIGRKHTFPAEESRRLKDFLEAADLVKFAAHQPREEDVDESIARAKDFIGSGRAEVVA